MILDLAKFIEQEKSFWSELEKALNQLDQDAAYGLELEAARRFYYLYQRASEDLVKLKTFACAPSVLPYLESLVARAYGEIHETRSQAHRLDYKEWSLRTLPQTFRRHLGAFRLAVGVMLLGALFGGMALLLDPPSKKLLMPFDALQGSPAQRVQQEENTQGEDRLEGRRASFSVSLMTHNTRISMLVMAMGVTWGIGTIVLLFYNGVMLGVVVLDYISAGQTKFLLGWLLPHGSIEIPAVLIAGQAGLVLAAALIGRGSSVSAGTRLRQAAGDIVTLIGGAGLLLVWAGFVESFLSQYHEPVVPYLFKIGFGLAELLLLFLYLHGSGVKTTPKGRP